MSRFVINPLGKPFNIVRDQPGVLSYRYKGATEGAPLADPGAGYMVIDNDAGMSLVFNRTDANGDDMLGTVFFIGLGSTYWDFWFFIHSKTRPNVYLGCWLGDWTDITEGEGEAEVTVGYSVEFFPWFTQQKWDADIGDYAFDAWEVGEELVISVQMVLNLDYLGTMATQDSSNVSISGGGMAKVHTDLTEADYLRIPIKATTGDPAFPASVYDGQIYLNTYDKKVRIYADEAWHTLLDYSE